MNLFSILDEAAKRWPEGTAVVHNGCAFRYSEIYSAVESLAASMLSAGIEAGDKVGLLCLSGPEHFVGFTAVLRAGGIAVPIPPQSKPSEIVSLETEMTLDAFCYSAQLKALIPQGGEGGHVEVRAFADRAPLVIRRTASHNTPDWEREQLVGMNAASIYFSSGTTSKAKGIILSHDAILERVNTRYRNVPLSCTLYVGATISRIPSPVYRSFLLGTKIVIADAINMQELARWVDQYGVTMIYGSPMSYRALLNEPGITAEELRGVRYFVSTTASVPGSIAEAFRAKFGREIVQLYGSIECGSALTNLSEDISKRGSVGTPTPSMEVKLVSGESHSSKGEAIGEICVRGPGMFDGYYRPWRLRDEVLENGWFRTGDLARRDADGYYWIVGRTKEVINVGGVKVFPQEMEEILLSHPAVEEAVVYGVTEARFGEVPHAKVKLRAGVTRTEREMMRHVNEKVSVFKSLRSVEFVNEIPKTVTGKPTRSA